MYQIAIVSFASNLLSNYSKQSAGSNVLYNYKVDEALKVKVDDIVVVASSNGLGLAKVFKVLDNNFNNAKAVNQASAWVVDVVDMNAHSLRIKLSEKREYLINQLKEKQNAVVEKEAMRFLGDKDPEAKKLLAELDKIDSGDIKDVDFEEIGNKEHHPAENN